VAKYCLGQPPDAPVSDAAREIGRLIVQSYDRKRALKWLVKHNPTHQELFEILDGLQWINWGPEGPQP